MKKFLALLLAMCLLGCTLLALADENITSIGPQTADGKGNTTVELNAEVAYVVTIPSKVSLAESTETGIAYSGSGNVTIDSMRIAVGKKLVVYLTDVQSGSIDPLGNLYISQDTVKVPYSIQIGNGTPFSTHPGQTEVLSCAYNNFSSSNKPTVAMTFTISSDNAPAYAGSYTDMLTFKVSIKDIEAQGTEGSK